MRTALSDFKESVDIIGSVANSLSSAINIRSDELKKSDTISCGCVLLMTGNFESFLKGIMKAFINELNGFGIPVEQLPEDFLHAHFQKGGAMLGRYAKEAKKGNKDMFDVHDLSERIASVNGPTSSYKLAWEAFTDTQANPGPDVVKSLLVGVGVKDVWGNINNLISQGRMDMFLTSFVAIRNVCAHTGSHPNPPTGAELQDACDKFQDLSVAIFLLLEDKLDELNPTNSRS